jgi:hypothetical protein
LVLNKPPKVPMKGHLPVHNSMDVLAAAALSYGSEEGPKLVSSRVVFLFDFWSLCKDLFSLCLVSSGPSTGQRKQRSDFDGQNKRKLYSAALASH